MRVICLHGYFKFEPERPSDMAIFNSIHGAGLVQSKDHYTFAGLKDTEDYSLKGKQYLNTICDETIEGRPWEVMRANNIVYNFKTGLSQLKDSVTETVDIKQSTFSFIMNGLIIPGSISQYGRVLSYSCFIKDDLRFFYDWIEYE